MNINHNLRETDIKNIDVKSHLEHQIQIHETKESGWFFDKTNSMEVKFLKTGKLSGSNYAKKPLRTSALIKYKNDDKYCFFFGQF